jgi:hypothetical protein
MGWLFPSPSKNVVTKDNDSYNLYDKGNGDISVRRSDSGLGRAFGSSAGSAKSLSDALDIVKSDSGSDIKSVK